MIPALALLLVAAIVNEAEVPRHHRDYFRLAIAWCLILAATRFTVEHL